MNQLTKSQYLLWAGQVLSPDAPLYNMPFRFDITGSINEDIFGKAFSILVSESDIMRSTFTLDEENLPVQQVHEDHDVQHTFLDWSEDPKGEGRLNDWISSKNQRMFDLTEVAYESVLIKVMEGYYLWYLNQHHIITDAWGISVQYQRMSEIYEALLKGQEIGSSLPVFSEYVEYENQQSQPSTKRKNKDYWEGKLKSAPPLANVYNFRASRQESASTRVNISLTPEDLKTLESISQEPDLRSFTGHITYFSVFLTALFSYLYRVSGQRQLSIGTPSHNRGNAKFKKTPGPFIEFFPLIVEIGEGETLGSLYQKVRKEVMSFLMNAGSGMASPELAASFNVVLNYIHAEFPNFAGISTDAEWMHIGHCDPRHDLRMHVVDYKNNGQVGIMLDMNNKVFEHNKQEAQNHLMAFVKGFIHDRGILVDDVVITNKKNNHEKAECPPIRLNSGFNLIEGDCKVAGSDNILDAKSLAVHWKGLGVKEGDRIAICLDRSIDFVTGVLASLYARCTYIPIPASHPKQRINLILKESKAHFVLSKTEGLSENNEIAYLPLTTTEVSDEISHPLLDSNVSPPAYIMYTSGSTGKPKGVEISHKNLIHYLQYASQDYTKGGRLVMPLFTSVGFDLTVTSLYLPLICGGDLHIYKESHDGPDLAITEVIQNTALTAMKLTPSHIEIIKDKPALPHLNTLIVGGEDFSMELGRQVYELYEGKLDIINEYGPTEATVGTIIHHFDGRGQGLASVPIGRPMSHVDVRIVNNRLLSQPQGVSGEILLGGPCVASGYFDDEAKTQEKFINIDGRRFYRTGDLAYEDHSGVIHYQGRIDQQLKLGGRRIEPGEIAQTAAQHANIDQAVVGLVSHKHKEEEVINCISCGLPSNFPGVKFDDNNECALCTNYTSYAERVKGYFRDKEALQEVFDNTNKHPESEYDCIMLLSGGKDSTYALAQLADMGLKVLAFTLDNGYISQGALDNAQRVCRSLGVDHVFGKTEAMNAIFVDSLRRHNNVCNGCFKVIYTLSTEIALQKKIPIIVTGLSRGQFFETRLTEELFWDEDASPDKIDDIILNARKEYHRVDDAVSQLMDVSFFEDDQVFEKVKFVDFYRYNDVELGDLMSYLKTKLPWVRPKDTGRSTNCLINQLGIHVHKKNLGYSNYAFPYSWDVRIGHKNRDESLDEINEEIDVPAVERIMEEIGYKEDLMKGEEYLTLFYTAKEKINPETLKSHLEGELPDYMVPWSYVHVDEIPLTRNGKVDMETLIREYGPQKIRSTQFVAPETDFEIMIAEVWKEVLLSDQVGVEDKFLELGGNSLMAIRVISRMNKKFRLELGLQTIFKYQTIRALAIHVEETIMKLLQG